jgi:asparagine synthase (glutamine-hydrolysing)
MCGIAALFAKKLTTETAEAIIAMASAVRHRGPDDEGFAIFGGHSDDPQIFGGDDTPPDVYAATFPYSPRQPRNRKNQKNTIAALGHRRLAILDLSAAGHQPMCTPDRRFWITFNGEIYNYIEIRKDLDALGYKFQTQTDTEVILAAYQTWGAKALSHFNGMFAFVIYDAFEHTLFAARDRFGVKPLYYWKSPQGSIAFASEIKQFTVLPGWKAVMDGQMAYDFLNWGTKNHTPETLFAGVLQLPPGHYLELRSHDLALPLRPQRWYQLTPSPFTGTMEEAAVEFRHLFTDAIKLRLRSDVPVGSCLSGGLDSSSIVCIANALLRETDAAEKQRTFIASSDVKRFDETDFAKIVVDHTQVNAHYVTPSLSHLFHICSDLIWHQDEPFVSTSQFAQWSVFELIKQHDVKVVLDGQGSDEQLAGYHGFFGNRFFDLFVDLKWKILLDEMRLSKQMHPGLQPIPLLFNKLTPDFMRQHVRKWLGKTTQHSGWFDHKKLGANGKDPLWKDSHRTVYDQSLQQIHRSSLPMLLHYEDRNSMAHSVESRTPFLDYRLVEFILGLPSEFKISQGWTKRVLRESMKGVLPEKIRTRIDKLGFVTAEEEWVRKEASAKFRQAVKEAVDAAQGIIHPSVFEATEKIINGKQPFNFLLWRLIAFGEWIKRFSVRIP